MFERKYIGAFAGESRNGTVSGVSGSLSFLQRPHTLRFLLLAAGESFPQHPTAGPQVPPAPPTAGAQVPPSPPTAARQAQQGLPARTTRIEFVHLNGGNAG